jgi:hypothetical protein
MTTIRSQSCHFLSATALALAIIATAVTSAGPVQGAPPAPAPPSPPAPSAAADGGHREEAKAEFNQGNTAYNLGKYQEAIAHFEKAYALSRVAEILFNLGQCYRKLWEANNDSDLGRRALHYYQALAREAPQSKVRADADQFVAELEPAVTLAEARERRGRDRRRARGRGAAPGAGFSARRPDRRRRDDRRPPAARARQRPRNPRRGLRRARARRRAPRRPGRGAGRQAVGAGGHRRGRQRADGLDAGARLPARRRRRLRHQPRPQRGGAGDPRGGADGGRAHRLLRPRARRPRRRTGRERNARPPFRLQVAAPAAAAGAGGGRAATGEGKPWYKRWWIWTIAGGVTLAAGGTAAYVGTRGDGLPHYPAPTN